MTSNITTLQGIRCLPLCNLKVVYIFGDGNTRVKGVPHSGYEDLENVSLSTLEWKDLRRFRASDEKDGRLSTPLVSEL